MATLPAYNPEIPYLGLIPGGLRIGSLIRIKGTMPYGGNRFSINLQTGAATRPRDDSALHLSVRPTDPVIVRNHWENNSWGTEERFGGCPIHPGQPFEILILAESTSFKIAINGVHFCHFNHRFSMHRVSFISVESDIVVTSITLDSDGPSAPPVPPPMPVIPIYPPSYPSPYPGHGHHPHYPHYPGHHGPPHHGPPHHGPPHHGPPHHGYPPHGGISHLPAYVPGPPPPPPYSPAPYPGHRHPYIHPRDGMATPATAYSLEQDPAYLKRKKKNKAIKYAAVAAGLGGGIGLAGLGVYALTRGGGDGDNGDGGDGGDFGDGGFDE